MTNNLSTEQISIAANWWADAVCKPKFDNGDTGPTGGITFCLATLASKPVPDESKVAFVASLSKVLAEKKPLSLSVDYDPCPILKQAMQDACIPLSNAPWKTNMYLNRGGVSVIHGYGAQKEALLPQSD